MNTATTLGVADRHPATFSALGRDVRSQTTPPPRLAKCREALGFLSEADLCALMHWSSVQTLSRREVIFRHGDPGTTVILVLEGYVKLFTLTEGREVVLDIVGPGTCLGKVSVLNKWPRSANATTLSPCRLMSIDGRQFRQAIEHRPEGLMAIMRMVSEGLQRRTERMVDTVALSAPARLAKTLLQLARLQSSSLHQANNVPLHLSQSELGSLTSLTRESVNKHLSTWRDAGWILLTGGSVMLRDVPALSRLLLDTSAPGMRAET